MAIDLNVIEGLKLALEQREKKHIRVGGAISFGTFKWRVLAKENGMALLITEDIIDQRAYNDGVAKVTWETCTLHEYLNGEEFKKNFSDEEWEKIKRWRIDNPKNPKYDIDGGNPTTDRVFLLSIQEAERYFKDNKGRAAKFNGEAAWWWLRSPGYIQDIAADVLGDGGVNLNGNTVTNSSGGVRPALWLNLESGI